MDLRRYRVAASCFEPDTTQLLDQRRQALGAHVTALLEEQRPDLLVLPELVLLPDFHDHPWCGAEPLEGPTVALAAELAARYSANLCLPIVEADGELLFNSAV